MKELSREDIGTLVLTAIGGLLIALLLAGCGTPKCVSCTGGGRPECRKKAPKAEAEISTATLKTLIASGVPLTIVDARTGKYDDGRRIPGAGNLAANAPADEIGKVIESKDRLVVTYCSNLKCPASAALAKNLRGLGYKNVLEYPYGIAGWVEDGNTTEKAGR